MHCISEHNTEACNRNVVNKSAMGVDAQLGDCLCPSLDGKSETFLVGKKTKMGFSLGIVPIPSLPAILQLAMCVKVCVL